MYKKLSACINKCSKNGKDVSQNTYITEHLFFENHTKKMSQIYLKTIGRFHYQYVYHINQQWK